MVGLKKHKENKAIEIGGFTPDLWLICNPTITVPGRLTPRFIYSKNLIYGTEFYKWLFKFKGYQNLDKKIFNADNIKFYSKTPALSLKGNGLQQCLIKKQALYYYLIFLSVNINSIILIIGFILGCDSDYVNIIMISALLIFRHC